jgi:short-chain Z-isoprenyl diphosphate synthase
MNPGSSPAHARAATLAFDKPTFARLDVRGTAAARTPPRKGKATALLLRFLYWIYERRLLDQLNRRPMPRHIGIILDGNRRHARMHGLNDPSEIYRCGADKLDDILDWCAELRIHAVTLWVFSTENLKRSRAEVSGILSAIEAKVAALAHDPFMHQNRVRIQAIGRLDLLPESVLAAIRAAEAATAQHDLMTLTIAVGYGGREEIADAVRSFVQMQARQGASLSDVIKRITPEAIACHLYAADLPDPDLIIRTSGDGYWGSRATSPPTDGVARCGGGHVHCPNGRTASRERSTRRAAGKPEPRNAGLCTLILRIRCRRLMCWNSM